MKEKKQLSVKTTYFLVAIFIVLIVGISFALPSFLVTLEGQNLNRIDSCSLNVNLKEGEGVTLLDTFPMSYNDAQSYDPLTFTLTKTGDCTDVNYNISMTSSCDTCEQTDGVCSINGSTCDCNNQIDSSFIDYELTNLSTGEITQGTNPYGLNLIDSFSAEEETINYEIKLWINEKATNSDIYISTETTPYTTKDFCAKLDVASGSVTAPEYCFVYTKDDTTMTAEITDYLCYEGNAYGYEVITDVVIPNTLEGYSVRSIKNGSFANSVISAAFYNKELTSVVFPNTLERIGYFAFYKNNLTNVVVPDSVTYIGQNAFSSNNLISLTLGNNTQYIGQSAFAGNYLTGHLFIPDSVTSIETYAFRNNNLTSVTIPNSVTGIAEAAFDCNHLTSVVIPDSVTYIKPRAFSGNNLTSVTIPDSVRSIGESAFAYNDLTSVVIEGNSNLTENTGIGQNAFSSSSSETYFSPNDGETRNYVDNPNLELIYNNSEKSFDWIGAITGTAGTPFIIGSVPSYGSNVVTITTGYPS